MNIKKVIAEWPYISCYYPVIRILFYDQDGNLFESGCVISDTNTKAETDNFIVTSLIRSYGDAYNPISAISTEVYKDINGTVFLGYAPDSNTFTIEFKTIK